MDQNGRVVWCTLVEKDPAKATALRMDSISGGATLSSVNDTSFLMHKESDSVHMADIIGHNHRVRHLNVTAGQ